jgi:aldehyde dehydrogenase (NAD+)
MTSYSNLKSWMKPKKVNTPMTIGPACSSVVYEPLGVVLIIGSWNFPYFTSLAPLIYAIAAGNTAIIKPSESAPNCSSMIRQLIHKNLDMNYFMVMEGAVKVASTLCTKQFDLICFTGGSETGKKVAAAAAQNLVPCLLELGGKSPCVLD